MPSERTRALLWALELLNDLQYFSKTPGVPDNVREQALRVLRHYPSRQELETIAQHESKGAFMAPMLDVETARDGK